MGKVERIPIDKLEKSIRDDVPHTAQDLKDILIRESLIEFKKEKDRGNFKRYKVLVDGRAKPVQAVKVGGSITFLDPTTNAKEVVRSIMTYLRAKSPIDSGLYSQSHRVFINGKRYTDAAAVPAELWNTAREVFIANIQPYGRKIESYIKSGVLRVKSRRKNGRDRLSGVKISKKRFWSDQAPRGVYKPALAFAKREYRNAFKGGSLHMEYNYRSISPGTKYKLQDGRYPGILIRRLF